MSSEPTRPDVDATQDRDDPRCGYVVLVYEHGRWVADWDGVVHATRAAGLAELRDCVDANYDAVLAECVVSEVGEAEPPHVACETCGYPGPSGHFETCALFDENDPVALTEREAE